MHKKKIIVYALGNAYEEQRVFIEQYFGIVGYYDKYKKDGTTIYLDAINDIDFDFVYITSEQYKSEIKKELTNQWGINEKKIISISDVFEENVSAREKYHEINNWKQVKEAVNSLPKTGEKIVIIGFNKYSRFFYKKVKEENKDRLWGIVIRDGDEILTERDDYIVRSIDELIFEKDITVYLFEGKHAVKIKGLLLEFGIDEKRIRILCEDESRGTQKFDTYDTLLGLSRRSDLQGFVTFEREDDQTSKYTIVTLGGSTTDPTLCNMKSWSEYLCEQLCDMGINARVICGGMASYTVTQELLMLLRDVIALEPNMVISYSGFNDAGNAFYCDKSYFTMKYQCGILSECIQKNMVKNVLQDKLPIDNLSYGLGRRQSPCQHWFNMERIMRAICKEFGIEFIGFLQPYSKEQADASLEEAVYSFYLEAHKLISSYDWLGDLTQIFDSEKNIYFDMCHVYEKGNRIIARNMLPYILRRMK